MNCHSDDGSCSLRHLGALSSLEVLDLEACVWLTDSALAAGLSKLGRLRRLNLSGCVKLEGSAASSFAFPLDPSSLLGSLPSGLQELCLDDCPRIGAAALASLATGPASPSLHTLSLRGCAQVNDAGLTSACEGLVQLSHLSLFSASGVTSRGLRALSRLPRLRTLHLSHCWNVDDEGLLELNACRNLVALNLSHCWKVSEAALLAMQQANPALDIVMG
jgi:hypothetical protein